MGIFRRARWLVVVCGVCLLLGGCRVQPVLSRIGVADIAGVLTTISDLLFGGGTGAVCLGSSTPGVSATATSDFTCDYVVDGKSETSTTHLITESGLIAVFVDPVILQVPAAATAFSGTYTGPSGTQNLQITPVTGTLRADINTNFIAEPGTKLLIVDFPTNPPINTTYSFTLHFELPGNMQSVPIKALFAAKVTVLGQTYYPPLLPCETNFANIAGVDMPQSTGFQPVTIPSVAGRGCAGRTYQFVPGASSNSYQGLWWASPANSESGWGINFAHQGDIIFATWFTYDATGRGLWLVMTAPKTGANTYSGTLYQTRGPAFNAVPFDPKAVVATPVGTGILTFTDANNGSFHYTIGAVDQTKAITREVFGPLPACTYGNLSDLALATNYQDLWWAKPAASESGWGINLNHEGDIIFATWFTYDLDGTPLWLVATAPKTSPGVYTGDLYRTTGPAYNVLPFDPSKVVPAKVGTATFTFSDGNNAKFDYSVQLAGMAVPAVQSKAITRELFSTAGTSCR